MNLIKPPQKKWTNNELQMVQRENFLVLIFEEGFKIFDKNDAHPSWVEGNLSSSYAKNKKRISKYLKDDEFKLVKGFVENTCKNIEPSKYGH